MSVYDAVVIGSGPGGYVSALRLAQLGRSVLLIEKDKLGGECTNYACIPSKALLHATKILDYIHRAEKYGIKARVDSLDLDELRKWRNHVVDSLRNGIRILCDGYGVEVIQGRAKIKAPGVINIEGDGAREVRAKSIVIATGSIPASIEGLRFDGERIMSTKEALEVRRIPGELLIVGGGAAGLELATLYARLGSRVSIVEIMPRLLPGFDEDVGRFMEKVMRDKGVRVMVNSRIVNTEASEGAVRVRINTPRGMVEESFDGVIVAAGRRPNPEGAESLGLKLDDKGHIVVDDTMRTSAPNVYAVGDVTGPPYLAHKAMRQGKVAAENIAGLRSSYDGASIPSVIYSDPEVISVGITEEEARSRGATTVIGRFPLTASGRARTIDEVDGFVKVIADAKTNRILGIHAVGSGVSEIAAEAAMIIDFMATLDDVELIIHPHPTLSEAILEAVEAARKRSVHLVFRGKP